MCKYLLMWKKVCLDSCMGCVGVHVSSCTVREEVVISQLTYEHFRNVKEKRECVELWWRDDWKQKRGDISLLFHLGFITPLLCSLYIIFFFSSCFLSPLLSQGYQLPSPQRPASTHSLMHTTARTHTHMLTVDVTWFMLLCFIIFRPITLFLSLLLFHVYTLLILSFSSLCSLLNLLLCASVSVFTHTFNVYSIFNMNVLLPKHTQVRLTLTLLSESITGLFCMSKKYSGGCLTKVSLSPSPSACWDRVHTL